MERGHLKPLDPQPLPDPLPARHNPSKYCVYHQQRGHGTDRCYRLRHEVQNLIDNRTIAPPSDPNDQVPHPHLNLIHTLAVPYDPSVYITPVHLPKPNVFIPESLDLCMMSASEPQSSQTHEPTTSELMKMIEDLQRTVADLAFGVLAPSSTTSRTREFMSKGSPTLGRVALEEGHSLGKVEASGKNKQVLAVVAKTVDDTFATQNESSSNQGASQEKGRCTRNVPFSSKPSLGRDQQTQSAPTNPFAGASSKTPQTSKHPPRGQRVFAPLYMSLSAALRVLIKEGDLKPLEPRPLPDRLPPSHDPAKYCAFHQQVGHVTDSCFRLRHEIQDLIDNKVIVAPTQQSLSSLDQ
ncbi:hypothetical protein HYC85_028443 [Camellia sinensis]|uniref:Retrotransposon gag domain-containing protein n=1 Tax=Camellia sinensis TaxID=4442 RepID=A0A7J7FVC1_CAMSI|nr:hypothetical protein HYC85_028443 [Camellia sinensis]